MKMTVETSTVVQELIAPFFPLLLQASGKSAAWINPLHRTQEIPVPLLPYDACRAGADRRDYQAPPNCADYEWRQMAAVYQI